MSPRGTVEKTTDPPLFRVFPPGGCAFTKQSPLPGAKSETITVCIYPEGGVLFCVSQ